MDDTATEEVEKHLNYIGDDILSQRLHHYRFIDEDDELLAIGNTASRQLSAVWDAVREGDFRTALTHVPGLRDALRTLSDEDWVVDERNALGRVGAIERGLKTLTGDSE
jgi:hypothetical protein